MSNNLDRIYRTSPDAADFALGYFEYLKEVLGRVDANAISAFAKLLLSARETGSRVFFIGNGGSAATADHFANDLGIGTRTLTKPFRAISLTHNTAVLTAIGNDHGFDAIFVQQLQVQMELGDVVVAISASGNSPNVIKAVEYARAHGATTVGITGFDGGRLMELADLSVHVPTERGEYGPVEDVHMVLDHLVTTWLCRAVSAVAKDSAVA